MTAGATPFKNDFLPNIYVPTIENIVGSGGELSIHGYDSIAYCVQTNYESKVTIKVNKQSFVPNLKFRLLVPQQIATEEKNNGLFKHEQKK